MYIELINVDDSVCESDWMVEKKKYDFYRFYYVKGGEAYYVTEKEAIPLKQWHLYIFPKNVTYTFRQSLNNPLNHLWFHVDVRPNIINKFTEYDLTMKNEVKCLLDTLKYLIFGDRNNERMTATVKLMLEILIDKGVITFKECSRSESVVNYVRKNVYTRFTLDDLAQALSFNKSHLTEIFVRETGLTPMRYIEKIKMEEACRLLADGVPVKNISDLLAYSDPNNFSRSFKRVYGVSPRDYLSNRN